MPAGYTQLILYEKRAVAWRGQLLRLSAGHAWGKSGSVIIADAHGAPVRFGTTWPIRFAVHNALELSRQINGAVLLVNRLREVFWH